MVYLFFCFTTLNFIPNHWECIYQSNSFKIEEKKKFFLIVFPYQIKQFLYLEVGVSIFNIHFIIDNVFLSTALNHCNCFINFLWFILLKNPFTPISTTKYNFKIFVIWWHTFFTIPSMYLSFNSFYYFVFNFYYIAYDLAIHSRSLLPLLVFSAHIAFLIFDSLIIKSIKFIDCSSPSS